LFCADPGGIGFAFHGASPRGIDFVFHRAGPGGIGSAFHRAEARKQKASALRAGHFLLHISYL